MLNVYLELLMQRLDVILHPLDKLCLVLPDGTTDVRAHKESIEAREYAEHLIGIPGSAQLISQAGSDSCLHSVNAFIIPVFSGKIRFGVKTVHS